MPSLATRIAVSAALSQRQHVGRRSVGPVRAVARRKAERRRGQVVIIKHAGRGSDDARLRSRRLDKGILRIEIGNFLKISGESLHEDRVEIVP
jgi:hypothetical protein